MTMNERVLITGGAGAVDRNLADELVLSGTKEIVVLDNFVRGRRRSRLAEGKRRRHGGRGRHPCTRRLCVV